MRQSLLILALAAGAGLAAAVLLHAPKPGQSSVSGPRATAIPALATPATAPELEPPALSPALGPPSPPDCRGPSEFTAPASDNARSLDQLQWSPLGTNETGWQAYAPLVGHEIGSACPPGSLDFAQALARWQASHGVLADGRMNLATFTALYRIWHARRPFARLPADRCPDPPAAADLSRAQPADSYGGKPIELRRDALAAYETLRAAARAERPEIAADPRLLQVFSGLREPAADLARCAADNACDNRRRTWCSAHRTGTAVDLYLGQAPGFGPDSTAPESRIYLAHTAAYQWLVANAARFGFVNYVYEPWHWEWAGDPARPTHY